MDDARALWTLAIAIVLVIGFAVLVFIDQPQQQSQVPTGPQVTQAPLGPPPTPKPIQ